MAADGSYGFDVKVLPYGSSVTYGDVTCESAESGMTCTDALSGHGFTVDTSAYEIW